MITTIRMSITVIRINPPTDTAVAMTVRFLIAAAESLIPFRFDRFKVVVANEVEDEADALTQINVCEISAKVVV